MADERPTPAPDLSGGMVVQIGIQWNAQTNAVQCIMPENVSHVVLLGMLDMARVSIIEMRVGKSVAKPQLVVPAGRIQPR